MGMAANEREAAVALRFGDDAVQLNLHWEGPAELASTQAAVLEALAAVGELMSAPRLIVTLAEYRGGARWADGPSEALAWPGPAAALAPQLERYLKGRGATPAAGAEDGLALASLGPVVARRVRVALPAGVDPAALGAGIPAEDERGQPMSVKVVPAEPVAGSPSVWLQSPSTDLVSGFSLHLAGVGEARLELSIGALLLDPSRDGRADHLTLAGAPLGRWRSAARAHLDAVQARLQAGGWSPRR